MITEGNYLLLDEPPWPAVRALLDEVWFVEVPEPVRRAAPDRPPRRVRPQGRRAPAAGSTTGSDAANARLVAESRARADAVVAVA